MGVLSSRAAGVVPRHFEGCISQLDFQFLHHQIADLKRLVGVGNTVICLEFTLSVFLE